MIGGTVFVDFAELTKFICQAFEHHGLSREHALDVADSMVAANLRGVDTHGVVRTSSYIDRLTTNLVNPKPNFSVTSKYKWALAVDGDNAMGAVASAYAMREVLARVEDFGVAAATVKRSNHFGAASIYALEAAKAGCIGIVLSPASKSLAPFGSMEPMFGTNPIAVAIPAGRYHPWALDMATSIAARGHIRIAAKRNEPIPEGWALDSDGRPTTDAEEALKGVMLPFAGPKGSALAMMVDVMGGVLSGSGFGGSIRDMTRDFTAPQDVGHFFLALKVDAFMPLSEFNERMEEEILRLKALKPAAGFGEVCYPGEPEALLAEQRRGAGIPIPPETMKVLCSVAKATGLGLPSTVDAGRLAVG